MTIPYTDHPEWKGILRDVLERPGEDWPRLVATDWLEDQGDGARAEFIRVQLRIAAMEAEDHGVLRCARCGLNAGWHVYSPRCRGGACSLRRREYVLSRRRCAWGWREGIAPGFLVRYGRGFPAALVGHMGQWLAQGKAILAAYPITRVGTTNKTPADGRTNCFPPERGHGWYRAGVPDPHEPEALPAGVWDALDGQGYTDTGWKLWAMPALAHSALSRALLRLAGGVPAVSA